MDTSGGSLRRSGVRPAPRDCTDHLSAQLQATAVSSLLGRTVWTPPAAACVGQVCNQRRKVAPTMLSPAPGHGNAIALEEDGVDTSGGNAATCAGQVCDQRWEVAPTSLSPAADPDRAIAPADDCVGTSGGSLRRSGLRPAPGGRTDHLCPAPGHGGAIAPDVNGADTSGGNLRRSGLRAAPGGRTDHLSVQLQATAMPSLLRTTVWTPPAAACVGQVCDQRWEVAPTMLSPAAGHGRLIAPEEVGVGTSGGSLRRSCLQPAPGVCTEHLSV